MVQADPIEPAHSVPGPSDWYKREHLAQRARPQASETIPRDLSDPVSQSPDPPVDLPFSIFSIPISEHHATSRLWTVLSLPKPLQRRKHGVEWHDAVWTRYTALSPFSRTQLPVFILRMVLHHVAPQKAFVQRWLPHAVKALRADQRDKTDPVAYPWEGRLQTVIANMLEAEAQQAEHQQAQQAQGDAPTLNMETVPAASTGRRVTADDFVYVLEQFAVAGHLKGTESVVKEMIARGVTITHNVNEVRLRALTKWFIVRSMIKRKYLSLDQDSLFKQYGFTQHSYGALAKVAKDFPTSMPNDIVIVLKELLQSLLVADSADRRRLSLDMLLRITKETGNSEAMDRILSSGYGFDMRYPDREGEVKRLEREPLSKVLESMEMLNATGGSEGGWAETSERRRRTNAGGDSDFGIARINTHALNTIIDGLGQKGQVWKMLTVMEVWSDGEADTQGGPGTGQGNPEQVNPISDTFFSATKPPEEPPLTLSEATRREEESGDRIGFFGVVTKATVAAPVQSAPPTSRERGRKATPSPSREIKLDRIMRFDDFLQPTSSMGQIVERAGQLAGRGVHLPADDGRIVIANSTTYNLAIYYSAVHAASKNAATSAGFGMASLDMGIYLARRAFREQTLQHSRFVEQWVWIREASRLAMERIPADEETGKKIDLEQVDRIHAWTALVRKTLCPPSVTLSAPMLAPLFSAMFMSGMRGRRPPRLTDLFLLAKQVKRQLLEELHVLVGVRGNAEDEALLAGSRGVKPSPIATSRQQELLSSITEEDKSLAIDVLLMADEGLPQTKREFILSDHLRLIRRTVRELSDQIEKEEARLERTFDRKKQRAARAKYAAKVQRQEEEQAAVAAAAAARVAEDAERRRVMEAQDQESAAIPKVGLA